MIFRGLRGGTFLAVFGVAAIALVVAAALIVSSLRTQLLSAIERNLIAEARMAAALVGEHETDGSVAALDAEADRIGAMTSARVSLVAADGRVVGDSAEDLAGLAKLDNHGTRPEIEAARRAGLGIERRHSATLGIDLLYVAIALKHPYVSFVRLALPLSDVNEQVSAAGRGLVVALVLALTCALALAWLSSLLLARRVKAIAAVARRYAVGDFSHRSADYGTDELGTVARVLDDTSRELGGRISELAQDRARMEAMLAGMLEGVVVVNEQGRVHLVNAAAKRMLRIEGEPAGEHFLEVVHQPDLGALIASALKGRSTEGLEFSPPRDANRTVVARVAPIGTGGSSGAVLVLHDITDLRQADRIRRDFVANVSHELRTPLTAIQGYVEALQDEETPEAGEARRFLEIIARHAKRMERLVHDLLRLARLEAGQEPVNRTPIELATALADVVTELSPAITAKQQQVVTHIDASAATLVTDAAKLHDAVRNLVENAVAYAPPQTTIELSAAREPGGTAESTRTVITVADHGPGIPEADLIRIFERFYRVDKARSRESGGTGLGLSIVKHLVDVLGGEVLAANRPEGGAIFTITLP
ncbi:MAG: ATP-binding protein [Acidobacteria bacterium]|nr:ATP-binding protein [Acidobacteriota bacterium]